MDKKLREYLRENEQVRWQGRPEPFALLEGSSKAKILADLDRNGSGGLRAPGVVFRLAEKNAGSWA